VRSRSRTAGVLWCCLLISLAANPSGLVRSSAGGASSPPALGEVRLTNELGRAVSLKSFAGQTLAITFFYTRCPMPDFCPRLSKNFQEASRKLEAMTNAPAHWHLLSVSFDPEFDTPAVLKAYGDRYQYNPAHWSFLTGAPDQIATLARAAGVTYQPGAGMLNHNFRTLIVDAAGHVRMIFPTGGNLSDQIVEQMIEAAAANKPEAQAQAPCQ
jgi:protein SCO1/2